MEKIVDYQNDPTGLPRSNVLRFFLTGGQEAVVRPSGTEPKLKVYLTALGQDRKESRIFPYGVYRRIWDWVPISYQSLFPDEADLNVFFNYIVPLHISGRVITTVHDMTWLRFPETMDKRNCRRLQKGMAQSIARSSHILTLFRFSKRKGAGRPCLTSSILR